MFFYSAYGLKIRSELALPELLPSESGDDVSIKLEQSYDPYSQYVPSASARELWDLMLTRREATLYIKNAGLFHIHAGQEITIHPAPEAEENLLRLYLVGIVMSILLYQRGLLILHASAVKVADGAVAFVGISGAGKTTIAATLNQRGYPIVTDDALALTLEPEAVTAVSGFPQIKVTLETANSLGYDPTSLFFLHSVEAKRGYRITSNFFTESLPLKCIYILGRDTVLDINPVLPNTALIELIPHTAPTRWFQSGDADHFSQCIKLIQTVPIYYLKRPHSLALLSDTAQLIEKHLKSEFQMATPQSVSST